MGLLRDLYRRFLLARHAPRHWRLRPGTIDARLFRHVVIDDEYRLPRFGPADVVLDVGAHTGSFALAALRRGAGRVVCCEPELGNVALLTHNLAPYRDRADVRAVAVWDRPGTVRLANPLDGRNTGAAQVRAEGLPVEAVAFDDLLRAAGRVRLVKLDCEGAEWPILLGSRELDRVAALCGEYHLPPLIEAAEAASSAVLVETLGTQGFRVELAAAPGSSLPVGLFFAVRE